MQLSALPRLVVAPQKLIDMAQNYGDYTSSPYSAFSAHSRDSSASDTNSPLTQTFSFQEHNRFSDSTSSLGTTPPKRDQSFESPRVSRTTLGDLVEVPDERDHEFDTCGLELTTSQCQCASAFCQRQCVSATALERPSLDYSLADGFNSDNEGPLNFPKVRKATADSPVGKFANRLGQRLPSLSRRLREKAPPAPLGHPQSARSAPASRVPSRTSSFRMPSVTRSFIGNHDEQELKSSPGPLTPPDTPVHMNSEDMSHTQIPQPMNIPVQTPIHEEPIDRKALASTPLLPTPMIERRGSDQDTMQSPLQSPSVADSPVFSFSGRPSMSTPTLPHQTTPPLSSRPSISSFGAMQSSQLLPPPERPFDESSRIEGRWAAKLGHANFTVYPTPYVPEHCNTSSCKRLVEDWEEARKQFINQAARTCEHYGPTSHIYKVTEQKWTEIDALWRKNHEAAVEQAKKFEKPRGDSPHELERGYQPLAEHALLSKLPSLNDPDNSGKFPKLDEADIVGPMVQYAQITTQASKRTAVLKFFKDLRSPSNTLGRLATG